MARRIIRTALMLVGIGLILYASVNIGRISLSLLGGTRLYAASLNPAAIGANRARWANVNPDIVGWLTVDGTGIDLPVLQDKAFRAELLENGGLSRWKPQDGEPRDRQRYKYLYCDYTGKPSEVGSITLDAVYAPDDPFVIIYGHNAHSPGVLFSDLKSFEDGDFFDRHTGATLYTETRTEALMLTMVCKISAYANEVYALDGDRLNADGIEAMLTYLDAHKLHGAPSAFDRYVLLSTCYETAEQEDRLVLLYGVCPDPR